MEAKNTIMGEPQKAGIYGRFARLKEESKKPIGYHTMGDMIAKAQAEISFGAGKMYGFEVGEEQGKAERIREVVEWVNENMWKQGSMERWQSQCKEWGIKDAIA